MPPAITGFNPSSGSRNSQVTLLVSGLPAGTGMDEVEVLLGQAECSLIYVSPPAQGTGQGQIEVSVPSDAPDRAVFSLQLENVAGWFSSTQTFSCVDATGPPRINGIQPGRVQEGSPTAIRVAGTSLDQVLSVRLINDEGGQTPVQLRAGAGSTSLNFLMPSTLTPSDYRVSCRLKNGRFLVSTQHVTVIPKGTLGGGGGRHGNNG